MTFLRTELKHLLNDGKSALKLEKTVSKGEHELL